MAKKTYIVIDPNGVQHTRKTDRVYTHAVAVRSSYAYDLKHVGAIWDVDRQNFDYHQKVVNSNGAYLASSIHPSYSEEQIADVKARNAERLAKSKEVLRVHANRDDYAAYVRDGRIAAVEKNKADGYYEKFGILGFNGRLDLAQKAAAAAHGGRYAAVVILEAQLKGA